MTKRWEPLLIAVTFLTCLIFAVHGVIPLAFLFFASLLILTPLGLFCLTAVATLAVASIVSGRARRMLTVIGSVLALIVWVPFLFWSDPILNTAFFSLHFLAGLVYVFLYRPTTMVTEP